ncbi:MAG: DUF1398 family protein [Bacteroidota bacterium]|nr:DUF1398 family protein [Bacteroidota bacterium]
MLTKEKIPDAQSKVKTGADYPRLVSDFKGMGIVRSEHWVAESANVYYGSQSDSIKIVYGQFSLTVNETASPKQLKLALKMHRARQTDYPTFCLQAAAAGLKNG